MSSAPRASRARQYGSDTRRTAALSALLLPIAPLVLMIVAAVYLGAGVRLGTRSCDAANDAAAPVIAPGTSSAPAPTRRTVLTMARSASGRTLAGAAALAAGVLFASTGAAGTFAFLNAKATLSVATISSGKLAMTIQSGSGAASTTVALAPSGWSNMLPGDIVGQQVTIANTGDAAASVTAALVAPSGASNFTAAPFQVRIAPGNCGTATLGTTALTTSPLAYGTFPKGTSTTACVQVTLPSDAAASTAGSNVPINISIAATQVAS